MSHQAEEEVPTAVSRWRRGRTLPGRRFAFASDERRSRASAARLRGALPSSPQPGTSHNRLSSVPACSAAESPVLTCTCTCTRPGAGEHGAHLAPSAVTPRQKKSSTHARRLRLSGDVTSSRAASVLEVTPGGGATRPAVVGSAAQCRNAAPLPPLGWTDSA